jgi:Chaperone of endosialidase
MALVLLDRAKETTIVVGTTASAILLGASSDYQSFAGVGNANTTYYCIAEQAGPNWEVGLGTYTLAGTILTRATTPLSSSNAGASVSFPAGTKDIFIVYPSAKGVWLDASGNAIGLGTPAAFVGTNITGTASGLTAGNVTINANLTGAVTSVGNTSSLGGFTSAQLATALTDETGTGSAVFATSPTLVTPILGTPSSGTLTNCTFPTLNQNTTGTASNITAYTINQNVGTANSPSFPSITTTSNLSIQIGGSASIGFYQDGTNTAIRTTASGSIYMQNASGTTTYGYFNSNGLNGNVQGNVSGSSGSCTGNAATATTATALTTTNNYQMAALGVGVANAVAGTIVASGNITAFSDERLKSNIVKIENALDKVSELNGYTFDRTDIDCDRQTGVIAQEVLEVLPEAVIKNENGIYSVAYGNMIGLLIEAIKEQQQQIDELRVRAG